MEEVRRAYGALSARYIELFGDVQQVDAEDLELIERHLTIRPGTVIDIGCGPGHLTEHLRSLGVDAIGIDLVPEFIDHARRTQPGGRYALGSLADLPVPDGSAAGVLAWYSLIHVPPDDLDDVLAGLQRAMAPGSTLVIGCFDAHSDHGDADHGDGGSGRVEAFDHKVVTAYRWPVDELAARLRSAGFTEVERQQRPGTAAPGPRPHAALVLRAER